MSLLASTKVELYDLIVCIVVKWRKISKSRPDRDLDLDPTMPIIELVRDIFIYYNIFECYVPRSITF